jgi:hypothetical protein
MNFVNLQLVHILLVATHLFTSIVMETWVSLDAKPSHDR